MGVVRIFEPNCSGHHLEYAAQIARECKRRGHDVILLTSGESTRSPAFEANIRPLGIGVQVEIVQQKASGSNGAWAAVFRQVCQPLIFPSADRRWLAVIAAAVIRLPRKQAQVFALVMRPPWGRKDITSVVKGRLWAGMTWISTLDVAALGDCFGELSQPVPPRIDVVADQPVLYRASSAEKRFTTVPTTILVGGVIDDRKAPLVLCRAALEFTGLSVRVAGMVDPSIRPHLDAMIDRFPGRLTIADGHLSNEELDAAVGDCDIVSVLLRTEIGSSGMLGRAVAYGRPVIAGGNQTVSSAVRKRHLGAVAQELNTQAVGAGLRELTTHWSRYVEAADRASIELAAGPALAERLVERCLPLSQ